MHQIYEQVALCTDIKKTAVEPEGRTRHIRLPNVTFHLLSSLTLHLEHASLLVDPPIHYVLTQNPIK